MLHCRCLYHYQFPWFPHWAVSWFWPWAVWYCGIACTGGERLLISCLLSSCCAISSCLWALLQVVLVATALYKSHPSSIFSAKSIFFCSCLHVFTICLSAKDSLIISKFWFYISASIICIVFECACVETLDVFILSLRGDLPIALYAINSWELIFLMLLLRRLWKILKCDWCLLSSSVELL